MSSLIGHWSKPLTGHFRWPVIPENRFTVVQLNLPRHWRMNRSNCFPWRWSLLPCRPLAGPKTPLLQILYLPQLGKPVCPFDSYTILPLFFPPPPSQAAPFLDIVLSLSVLAWVQLLRGCSRPTSSARASPVIKRWRPLKIDGRSMLTV